MKLLFPLLALCLFSGQAQADSTAITCGEAALALTLPDGTLRYTAEDASLLCSGAKSNGPILCAEAALKENKFSKLETIILCSAAESDAPVACVSQAAAVATQDFFVYNKTEQISLCSEGKIDVALLKIATELKKNDKDLQAGLKKLKSDTEYDMGKLKRKDRDFEDELKKTNKKVDDANKAIAATGKQADTDLDSEIKKATRKLEDKIKALESKIEKVERSIKK